MAKKRIRKSGDQRREEIKNSILEIVSTEGMHKLSTRYLATKVGVSEGALFRHYPTKKAMIEDIIRDVNNEMINRLKNIAAEDSSPEYRLDRYITFTLDYLYQKRGITLILFTEASYQNDEGLKHTLDTIYKSQIHYFQEIVLDGISKGIWNNNIDVDDLAHLYMGIPITLNIELVLEKDNFDHSLFTVKMKKLIFKILSK